MSLYADYLKRFPNLISCLENARSQGRFAHSFLIHSPDEKVRREFVAVLAQIAGCHNSVNGRPDTTCQFCRKIEAGLYMLVTRPNSKGAEFIARIQLSQVGDNSSIANIPPESKDIKVGDIVTLVVEEKAAAPAAKKAAK